MNNDDLVTFRLEKEIKKEFAKLASLDDLTVSQMLRRLVREKVEAGKGRLKNSASNDQLAAPAVVEVVAEPVPVQTAEVYTLPRPEAAPVEKVKKPAGRPPKEKPVDDPFKAKKRTGAIPDSEWFNLVLRTSGIEFAGPWTVNNILEKLGLPPYDRHVKRCITSLEANGYQKLPGDEPTYFIK